MIKPPESINILQNRATLLAGKTVAEIASMQGKSIPENLVQAKGWMGEVLESALGASAGNKAQPDFVNLGIELKTLPINRQGKPLESTYVTTLPLTIRRTITWRESEVYAKLKHVLWIPIISERNMPVCERVIANPFLWQLPTEDEAILATDWQEIIDMVALGQITQL